MKSVKLLAIVALSSLVMSFKLSTVHNNRGTEFTIYTGSAAVWKSEEIDLGNIPQGKPVTVQFEFTNSSKEPIIIATVGTSCGCTVADYSKKPIMANEKSSITATYNAASVGAFTKAITVTFANNEVKVLNIKGTAVQ